MWLLIAVVSLALASAPDKAPASFGEAGGSARGVSVTDNGAVVVAASDGQALVLGTNRWSLDTWSGCTVTAVAARQSGATGDVDVWAGCDSGELHGLRWDEDGGLSALSDDAGALVFALGSEGATESVKALFWGEDEDTLFVLSEAEDRTLYGHALLPDEGSLDAASGFPVTLLYDGFVDAVMTATRIIVAHGSDDVSYFSRSGGSAITPTTRLGVDLTDIVGTTWDSIYGVDSKGYLVQYSLSSMQWTIALNDLDDAYTALAMSMESDESWVLLGNDLLGQVYPMSGTALGAAEPEAEFELPVALTDAVVGPEAFVYATTEDGRILVLTSRPWVSDLSASPSSASEGDTVRLGFTVDEGGAAQVRRGGDRSANGALLWEGDVDAGPHEVELSVDADWAEGDNALFVFVSDEDGRGHAATSVFVDNPPSPPTLTEESLGFGEGYLVLSFEGIPDADLDHYTVYITTTPFDPADWPTGGPSFDGDDALESPVVVEAEGGEAVDVRIAPLTNGQTYYLAVRATDEGGLEGDMSEVVSGSPRPTYSAAELSGEEGGYPECGPGLGAVGWLVLLGAGALTRRRSLALGALAAVLVAPGIAHAGKHHDYTPAVGDFEVRYGDVRLDDPNIQAVYGERGHDTLLMEVGPQFYRVLELDLGFGFYQDMAWSVDEGGEASGERAMLSWFPLSASGTLRLHILDEQLLVPFGSLGVDYLLWNEKQWDPSLDEPVVDMISGGKTGWHWAVGGNLLLDFFAPGRAATLESQTEINDTWLVVEYRKQRIEDGQGLDFSGRLVTVGLKLDF